MNVVQLGLAAVKTAAKGETVGFRREPFDKVVEKAIKKKGKLQPAKVFEGAQVGDVKASPMPEYKPKELREVTKGVKVPTERAVAKREARLKGGGRSMAGRMGRYALGALAVGGAATGISELVDHIQETKGLDEGYKKMLKMHPDVREGTIGPHGAKVSREAVKQRFNTLATFSPRLARDPLVSGSFIRQTISRLGEKDLDIKSMADMARAGKALEGETRAGKIRKEIQLPGASVRLD